MFWLIPRAIEAGAENLKMIGDQINQLVADYEESEGSVPFLADYIKDYRDEYWVLAEMAEKGSEERRQTSQREICATFGDTKAAMEHVDRMLCMCSDFRNSMAPAVMLALLQIKDVIQGLWDGIMSAKCTITRDGWAAKDPKEPDPRYV